MYEIAHDTLDKHANERRGSIVFCDYRIVYFVHVKEEYLCGMDRGKK